MDEGKAFFDVWMYEVSDDVQAVATAFGDRFMLEHSLATMKSLENVKAQQIVERIIFLHSVYNIKNNLGWYLINGCVSNEAAQELDSVFEKAVKDLLPHLNTAVEALGIVDFKHLIAPIGRDYVAFNAQ